MVADTTGSGGTGILGWILDSLKWIWTVPVAGYIVWAYIKPCKDLKSTLEDLLAFMVQERAWFTNPPDPGGANREYAFKEVRRLSDKLKEFQGRIVAKSNTIRPVHWVFAILRLVPRRQKIVQLSRDLHLLAGSYGSTLGVKDAMLDAFIKKNDELVTNILKNLGHNSENQAEKTKPPVEPVRGREQSGLSVEMIQPSETGVSFLIRNTGDKLAVPVGATLYIIDNNNEKRKFYSERFPISQKAVAPDGNPVEVRLAQSDTSFLGNIIRLIRSTGDEFWYITSTSPSTGVHYVWIKLAYKFEIETGQTEGTYGDFRYPLINEYEAEYPDLRTLEEAKKTGDRPTF